MNLIFIAIEGVRTVEMEKIAHSMAELTPGLLGQAALFESYCFSLSS